MVWHLETTTLGFLMWRKTVDSKNSLITSCCISSSLPLISDTFSPKHEEKGVFWKCRLTLLFLHLGFCQLTTLSQSLCNTYWEGTENTFQINHWFSFPQPPPHKKRFLTTMLTPTNSNKSKLFLVNVLTYLDTAITLR